MERTNNVTYVSLSQKQTNKKNAENPRWKSLAVSLNYVHSVDHSLAHSLTWSNVHFMVSLKLCFQHYLFWAISWCVAFFDDDFRYVTFFSKEAHSLARVFARAFGVIVIPKWKTSQFIYQHSIRHIQFIGCGAGRVRSPRKYITCCWNEPNTYIECSFQRNRQILQ